MKRKSRSKNPQHTIPLNPITSLRTKIFLSFFIIAIATILVGGGLFFAPLDIIMVSAAIMLGGIGALIFGCLWSWSSYADKFNNITPVTIASSNGPAILKTPEPHKVTYKNFTKDGVVIDIENASAPQLALFEKGFREIFQEYQRLYMLQAAENNVNEYMVLMKYNMFVDEGVRLSVKLCENSPHNHSDLYEFKIEKATEGSIIDLNQGYALNKIWKLVNNIFPNAQKYQIGFEGRSIRIDNLENPFNAVQKREMEIS